MTLQKQLEALKAERETLFEDKTYVLMLLEKGLEELSQEEFDEKNDTLKTLEKELATKDLEIATKQASYDEQLIARKNAITASHNKKTMEDVEDQRGSKAFEDAWVKAIKTGDSADFNKFLASNDGVTAGDSFGATVPTFVAQGIERKLADYGHLLTHANITSIRGILRIPIEVEASGAGVHAEGSAMLDEETITLEQVVVDPVNIKKWISWTDELEAMSSIDLMNYLVNEFVEKIIIKAEKDMLHGADANKGLYGIVTEAKAGSSRVKTIKPEKLDFTLPFQALGEIRSNEPINFYMNRTTFYSHIATITDLNGNPLYGVDAKQRPTFSGMPVLFTDELPAYDVATEDQAVIVALAKNAYRINAPEGLTPSFILDPYTLAREDKKILVGRMYLGGRLAKHQGAVVITKK